MNSPLHKRILDLKAQKKELFAYAAKEIVNMCNNNVHKQLVKNFTTKLLYLIKSELPYMTFTWEYVVFKNLDEDLANGHDLDKIAKKHAPSLTKMM